MENFDQLSIKKRIQTNKFNNNQANKCQQIKSIFKCFKYDYFISKTQQQILKEEQFIQILKNKIQQIKQKQLFKNNNNKNNTLYVQGFNHQHLKFKRSKSSHSRKILPVQKTNKISFEQNLSQDDTISAQQLQYQSTFLLIPKFTPKSETSKKRQKCLSFNRKLYSQVKQAQQKQINENRTILKQNKQSNFDKLKRKKLNLNGGKPLWKNFQSYHIQSKKQINLKYQKCW